MPVEAMPVANAKQFQSKRQLLSNYGYILINFLLLAIASSFSFGNTEYNFFLDEKWRIFEVAFLIFETDCVRLLIDYRGK